MFTLGIVLMVLGTACDIAGALSIAMPQLRFLVPQPVAIAFLVLGGLLTGGGMLCLVL